MTWCHIRVCVCEHKGEYLKEILQIKSQEISVANYKAKKPAEYI